MYQMANRHRSFQLCVSTKKGLFHTTLSLCCNKTFHQDSPFFCSVIDHSGPPRKRAPCRRLIPSVFMVTNCSFSGCSALLCLNYLLPLSSNGHLASIVDLHLQRDSMTSRRRRCVACFVDFPSLFLLLTLWWIWHRLRVKLLLFLPQWQVLEVSRVTKIPKLSAADSFFVGYGQMIFDFTTSQTFFLSKIRIWKMWSTPYSTSYLMLLTTKDHFPQTLLTAVMLRIRRRCSIPMSEKRTRIVRLLPLSLFAKKRE